MKIRPAIAADIPALMGLEKHAVTAAHWSRQQYDAIFSQPRPRRVALVIEEELAVQGFLVGRVLEGEWEIENIAIAGSARRRGLGTRLLGEFLDLARAQGSEAVFLEVRESNQAARSLYEKWGFLEGGRRPRYYHDPEEDAIVYRMEFH
ncbi:MAG: ribosomal protein S18-alanine N-acetyltransferase [Acidobacteriia bacterium]|nr:ribosomal protein S18-alanine N-acetyltransferase [Terriglobia bacterium]